MADGHDGIYGHEYGHGAHGGAFLLWREGTARARAARLFSQQVPEAPGGHAQRGSFMKRRSAPDDWEPERPEERRESMRTG